MKRRVTAMWCGMLFAAAIGQSGAAPYTRLEALPAPAIAAAAEAFPGGGYEAANLLKPSDAARREEYASRSLGTNTFAVFDFGRPVRIAAFRHAQRKWPDTIATSELIFGDTPDLSATKARVPVTHVDESDAVTLTTFPPVEARYVRWQVKSLVKGTSPNLGGRGVVFFRAGARDERPSGVIIEGRTVQVIDRAPDGGLEQPFRLTLDSPYAQAVRAVLTVEGEAPRPVTLSFGRRTETFSIAATDRPRTVGVTLESEGAVVVTRPVAVESAAKRTVYILPHSHTDIGYTEPQTAIEEKQVNNLMSGIEIAERTAGYPKGARFVWNVEVLWAADLYLRRLDDAQRDRFLKAAKRGQIAFNGMYLNELTGLCRPEELLRLFRYSKWLEDRCGVTIDSAMISDVPGCAWGTVTAMAQAGIRYFSVAPNYFDRIGDILVKWENRPFWWIGPDGRNKVLVWIPFWGYAMSHRYGRMSPQLVEDFSEGLEANGYPYDVAYVRWSGHGDNAVPDPSICDFVRVWNAAHAWPQFVIGSTSEAFKALEDRHGKDLPTACGDWTPYWEDGAGSSALETAMNRNSSDRLAQAEALWAMLAPGRYPAADFESAWRSVLLYSEHTWGAYCSVSGPLRRETLEQWDIKRSYAESADAQSRELLERAKALHAAGVDAEGSVDVFNTTSWPRTELLTIPQALAERGDRVLDADGNPVPSQRVSTRDLVVLVTNLPPFCASRFTVTSGPPAAVTGPARADGRTLDNGIVRVTVDEKTGAIAEFRMSGLDRNLADTSSGGLNDYLYFTGDNAGAAQRNGPVQIRVKERGPLLASLEIVSDAPGCRTLVREVRLTAGLDHVEIVDLVDKRRIESASYHAADGKESLNFGFAFDVPGGRMRLDLPLGVMEPEKDQIPSACKNWFTIGRWADVANGDYGVTWVTLDAPLVQVGGLTANLLNSQSNPDVWRKKVEPTQKLFCWAMNNHWGTNYRAWQEGPVTFRFVLRPHRTTTTAEASRFATGFSQPLVAVRARGDRPRPAPRMTLDSPDVSVLSLKPSDDGEAWIVRLFGDGGRAASVRLLADGGRRLRVWHSDLGEKPLRKAGETIDVPGYGVVTLRVERQDFKAATVRPVNLRGQAVGKPVRIRGGSFYVPIKAFAPAGYMLE